MSTGPGIEIEGFRKLQQQFTELTEKLQRKALRDSLRSAAAPVKTDASKRTRRRTGQLSGDVAISVSVNKSRAEAKIGMKERSWYGRFQELGTLFVPADPFLRPALDTKQGVVVKRLKDGFKRVINRIALKGKV